MSERNAPANFKPQWWCNYRPPRNPAEAQRLYNHIRTTAYLLDASSEWLIPALPFLANLPQEMQFGIDSVLGALLPAFGDLVGLFLGVYQVILSMLFGLPYSVVLMMIGYLIADALVGIIPLIGDFLDVAFKANLYNLKLLEKELKRSRWAPIVIIPAAGEWIPRPRQNSRTRGGWQNFFRSS